MKALIIVLLLVAGSTFAGELQERSPNYREPVNQDGWAHLSLGIGLDRWNQSAAIYNNFELVETFDESPLSARLSVAYVQPLDWRTTVVLSAEWVPSFESSAYEFGAVRVEESLSRLSFTASLKIYLPRQLRNAVDDDSGWKSH